MQKDFQKIDLHLYFTAHNLPILPPLSYHHQNINFMAIHVLEQYVSVEDYAKRCSISRRSVMNRIAVRSIYAIKVDGYLAVDIGASPPKKFIHASEPHNGGARNSYTDLRCVIWWCSGKQLKADRFFRAIIVGTIEAWVIGGEVFARATDLEAFKKG